MTMREQIEKGQKFVSDLIKQKATFHIDEIVWTEIANKDASELRVRVNGKIKKEEFNNEWLQHFRQQHNKDYFEEKVWKIIGDIESGNY